MRSIQFLFILISLGSLNLRAQTDDRTITTAMSFLLNRPDARSSAMGDIGAASTADAYAIYANPSKIAFGNYANEVGLSYVPLMSSLAKDIKMVNFSGYRKLDQRNTLGLSVYYMDYGQVDGYDEFGNPTQAYYPAEYTLDLTYARKMGEEWSMGLTGRFLHTNNRYNKTNNVYVADPASAFAVDVSLYADKELASSNNGHLAYGVVISNLGTKLRQNADESYFLPMNLKLGTRYDFLVGQSQQKLSFALDLNKLLVPTPPVYDINGNITDGRDPNRSVVSALFTSFFDAPGGFSEEISEISAGLGVEYLIHDIVAFRTGYYHESMQKGGRRHLGFGIGTQFRDFNFDLAYVIPTTNHQFLRNTLKISLGYHFE